jgi:hypothetical protein
VIYVPVTTAVEPVPPAITIPILIWPLGALVTVNVDPVIDPVNVIAVPNAIPLAVNVAPAEGGVALAAGDDPF